METQDNLERVAAITDPVLRFREATIHYGQAAETVAAFARIRRDALREMREYDGPTAIAATLGISRQRVDQLAR